MSIHLKVWDSQIYLFQRKIYWMSCFITEIIETKSFFKKELIYYIYTLIKSVLLIVIVQKIDVYCWNIDLRFFSPRWKVAKCATTALDFFRLQLCLLLAGHFVLFFSKSKFTSFKSKLWLWLWKKEFFKNFSGHTVFRFLCIRCGKK